MPTILLTGFGDWIDSNFGVIVTGIGAIITQLMIMVAAFAVLRYQVGNNSKRIDDLEEDKDKIIDRQDRHREDYRAHLADTGMHVNHQHMKSIEHRIDKMEGTLSQMQTTMSGGFSRVLQEIRNNGK